MEQSPESVGYELDPQKLPIQVEQVAKAIYRALADDLGLDYTAKTLTGHSVLFTIDPEEPLTLQNFNILASEYAEHAVNIEFNEDDQTILVAPMRNWHLFREWHTVFNQRRSWHLPRPETDRLRERPI